MTDGTKLTSYHRQQNKDIYLMTQATVLPPLTHRYRGTRCQLFSEHLVSTRTSSSLSQNIPNKILSQRCVSCENSHQCIGEYRCTGKKKQRIDAGEKDKRKRHPRWRWPLFILGVMEFFSPRVKKRVSLLGDSLSFSNTQLSRVLINIKRSRFCVGKSNKLKLCLKRWGIQGDNGKILRFN